MLQCTYIMQTWSLLIECQSRQHCLNHPVNLHRIKDGWSHARLPHGLYAFQLTCIASFLELPLINYVMFLASLSIVPHYMNLKSAKCVRNEKLNVLFYLWVPTYDVLGNWEKPTQRMKVLLCSYTWGIVQEWGYIHWPCPYNVMYVICILSFLQKCMVLACIILIVLLIIGIICELTG